MHEHVLSLALLKPPMQEGELPAVVVVLLVRKVVTLTMHLRPKRPLPASCKPEVKEQLL